MLTIPVSQYLYEHNQNGDEIYENIIYTAPMLAEEMGGDNKRPHIIIIPPPFQGHINPSIQLSLNLASKGFTITYINTHSAHDQIKKARVHIDPRVNSVIFARAHDSGLDVGYTTIGDGFPLSFDLSSNREQFLEGRLHVFPSYVDEAVGELVRGDPPATCLIADTYSTWGSAVARKYGLVYVSFWTQPALVLTLYYHLDLLKKNGHYGCLGKTCKDPSLSTYIFFFNYY